MMQIPQISPLAIFFSILFTSFLGGSALDAGEPTGKLSKYGKSRTWEDATGKHKILGSMKTASKSEVQIAQSNGKTVKIKLQGLSAKDQAFVEEFLNEEKAGMAAGGVESPFQEVGGDDSEMEDGSSGSESSSTSAFAKRQVNVKNAKKIVAKLDKAFWSAKPARGFPEVKFEEFAVATDISKPFFSGARLLSAGRSGVAVMNVYQQGGIQRDKKGDFSRMLAVFASDESVTELLEMDTPWKLMAISPDGSRVAAVRVEGFDKGNDVGIFKVTKQGIVPEYQFTAGGGAWDELRFVAFAGPTRLVTISQKFNLAVWDLNSEKSIKALFVGNSGGAMTAEMSLAGEYMLLPAGNSVALIDIAAAKVVGILERTNKASKMKFSPDGTKLALYEPFDLSIYSLEDGKLVQQTAVSEHNPDAPVRWLGKYVMVGNVVYDPERKLPLWTYESSSEICDTLGSYLFTAFAGEKGTTLTVNQLPHSEAISKANSVDPSQIYAIRPGDAVDIQYNLRTTPAEAQSAIRKAVEEKVQKLGWKVTSGASHVITVEMEEGASASQDYYTRTGFGPMPPSFFGGPPSGPKETVTYKPWTHKLNIKTDGTEVYSVAYVRGAPDNISLASGESTQSHVSKFCQPAPNYFKDLPIAPNLLKKEFQGGLGKSKLSSDGVSN